MTTPPAARHFGTAEPGAHWIKSSASFSNGNCVQVAALPGGQVGVRHSHHPDGPVLQFTPAEWDAFLHGARNGEFDHFAQP